MTPLLEWAIFSFIIVITIIAIVLTIFAVDFIKELTSTMANIKEITDTTKKELVPALKSVNDVLLTVSNISLTTNRQIELAKKILAALIGAFAFSNAKSGGFLNGLLSGFNLFRKKRR